MDGIDFVIVNSKLHAEFDSFKKKEVDPSLSYIEINPLVEFYLQQKKTSTQAQPQSLGRHSWNWKIIKYTGV